VAFYFYFGFLFSTSTSQMVVPLLALLLMDCKALSLGELSGQGDGRGPEHRTQANPVSWLRRVYAARWGGGGGAAPRPPAQRRLRPAGTPSNGA
jgi:hypothetical protein